MTKTMTAGAATLALALGGCGSDDKKSETRAEATPQQAVAEIDKTRRGIETAAAAYAGGDKAKADTEAGNAYLEHFEHVEGPLGKLDEELNEKIEEALRDELRAKIKAGAPQAEVAKLVETIKADLAKAEAKLRKP